MQLKNLKKAVFCTSIVALAAFTAFIVDLNFWQKPQDIVSQPLAFSYCKRGIFEQKSYIICRADPKRDDIRLFLHNDKNESYKRFAPLNAALSKKGETLAFAMNAGMYHADYNAVGLYVENGQEKHAISTKDGSGNFHMKPNGIFYIDESGGGVLDTQSYLKANIEPPFLTQTGPMLVINNKIHHRFIPNSTFLEYRNGVGITSMGEAVFVISEEKVNFDEMARFFRDALGAPNALFLDGSISSLYAPEMGRTDWWYPMGPIVGVVVKLTQNAPSPPR